MTLKRRQIRGFSMVEVMVAGAIFLIGIMSATALVMMSSQRRGHASKSASMSRIISEEYLQLTRFGYDGLDAGSIIAYDRLDPDGRKITFSGFIGTDCNAVAGDAGTNLSGPDGGLRADPGMSCCPGSICCKLVRLDAAWQDTSVPGSPPVNESYLGFITKSCQ